MTLRQLRLSLLIAAVIIATPRRSCAQVGSCKATLEKKITICVDPEPLTYDRCQNLLKVRFRVASYIPTVRYKYVLLSSDQQTGAGPSYTSGFIQPDLTSDSDPHDDDHLRFQEAEPNATYKVTIKVSTEDKSAEDTLEISKPFPVHFERHVYALVIGVSSYKNGKDRPDNDTQITNLRFAAHDAESFRKLLKGVLGENTDLVKVEPLTNSEATTSAIRAALRSQLTSTFACRGGTGGDLFILYYSGHTFIMQNSDTRYLGAWDINPSSIKADDITYDEIIDTFLKKIHANKLVILDSCFSGTSASTDRVADAGPDTSADSRGSLAGMHLGGKLEIIADGHMRQDYAPLPDKYELESVSTSLNFIGSHAELGFYTAAEMNVEAQEGVVLEEQVEKSHFVFMNEPAAAGGKVGHGLYTYELLVALENQIPASRKLDDLSDDGDYEGKWGQSQTCKLDFAAAHNQAAGAISQMMNTKRRVLQHPTDVGMFHLQSLTCTDKQATQ